MYLTLEVVSPQAATLGGQRRRTVGPGGLTIGRQDDNDWIIPDSYVSKHHARITFANGGYFVEGLGRNPLAIGSAENVIPNNQPRRLKSGDRLFIDQYEVLIGAVEGEPPETGNRPVPVSDDPFGVLDTDPGRGSLGGSTAAASADPFGSSAQAPFGGGPLDDPLGRVADTAELDPLAALGGAKRAESELPPVNWQQASPLSDHIELPAPHELLDSPELPGSREAGSGIPANWDKSVLLARARPASPQGPPPSAIPDSWDQSVLSPPRPNAGPQLRSAGAGASARPQPSIGARPQLSRAPEGSSEAALRESDRPQAKAPQGPAPQATQRMTAPQPTTGPQPVASPPADFANLLRAAGLPDRDLSPDVLAELGAVLRVVVHGVMEVLRARTEIKSQFRLPLTRVQAAENNPLKLSPNVESALHTLLVQRNPGFLPTVQAFEDAFADIRNHQMAMLEGIRVAFDSMLKELDPRELEAGFERSAKRGGLLGGLGAKTRYWDLYVERFSRLGSDADDVFRRLFGDVFAEAYEKQLERLKTLARRGGHG
jgi:type VI secretion system FHA domain protein